MHGENTKQQPPHTPSPSLPPFPFFFFFASGCLSGDFSSHGLVGTDILIFLQHAKILITLDQIVMCKDRGGKKKTLPLGLLCQHSVGICATQGPEFLFCLYFKYSAEETKGKRGRRWEGWRVFFSPPQNEYYSPRAT